MPKGIFDDAEIEIPCPKCGYKTKQTIGRLRDQAQFECVGCGTTIKPSTRQFDSALNKVDQSIDDLRRQLATLGKRR